MSVLSNSIRRHAPLWISILAGIALWEIAGRSTSAAFMVPLSETLVRLWQLISRGEFISQLLDSSELFLTGFAPKVLVVFLFTVFPVLYNTVEGARSMRPELIEVAKSFRSSEWALWREVMLPYTLPYTMTGVRQAIGRALVGMIAAEFFLSSTGLGQLIMGASQDFDTAGVFASILVIGVIGVGLTRLGLNIEQHFAKWRQ